MKKNQLKLSLLGAMLLAMSTTVNAQWTENATAVYLNSTTKNVGIGTTTPAFALDLIRSGSANLSLKSTTGTSNLLLDRANSAATSSVSYRTNGVGTWQTGTVGNDNFNIRNIGLGNTAMSISAANNNVGIGTGTPQHKLTVGGNTADGQTVTVRGYSNSPLNWKGGAAFGYNQASVIMGELSGVATIGGHDATLSSWTNLSINPGGGFVGIGTTSPITPLDVNGTGKFGSYLKIGTDVDEGYFQNAQDGAYRALQTGGDQGYWFQNYNGVKTTMYVGLNGTYDGNVGIGTTTPQANLHITNPGSTSRILLGESNMNGGYTAFDISTSANVGGYCNLQSIKSAGSAWGDIVLNRDGGSVAIGSTKVATGYKLSVNGSIMCTALRVQDFASWPDYVFANDYNLKSLSEVENYIATNKRLPGMPSDCEVLENGIDVGQMQAKVVEKVEENTLYIIQLSKENQELKAQLKAIQAQLNAMQK